MTTTDHLPDVAAFVAEVRDRLADLPADERDELIDGLEADLADQLADGGATLPDPAAYAAELRAAAGLPVGPRRGRVSWGSGGLGAALDTARAWWGRQVTQSRQVEQAWSFVQVLRPVWWVLRAWAAVSLLDVLAGPQEPVSVVPHLGVPGLGPVLLLGAVVGSVLLGQGRLWSGPARSTSSRVLLLGLNAVAVLVAVGLGKISYSQVQHGAYVDQATYAQPAGAVVVDGRAVHNIYAYDAQGLPLTGVQLFDAAGRPIALSREQAVSGPDFSSGRVVGCPWLNGTRRVYNVFPLPERPQQRRGCQESLDPRLGSGVLPAPPLAQVPPVVLPTATPR